MLLEIEEKTLEELNITDGDNILIEGLGFAYFCKNAVY